MSYRRSSQNRFPRPGGTWRVRRDTIHSPFFILRSSFFIRLLMTTKSLDQKLARIHADPHGCRDFILADAKDADMALSIGAPGCSPEAHSGELRYRSLQEFRDIIVQIVEQKLV